MAVPTIPRSSADRRRPAPGFLTWIRKLGFTIGRPVFSVILAIIAGGIVIVITSTGSLGDRFSAATSAYQALFSGSFGTVQSFAFTLVGVGPLILAGVSVAIAYRAKLFNVGAEGQLAVGAMVADIIGIKASGLPGWLLIPSMIIAAALAGAVWGGIVGFLKAWRGAHEVVTTIMLNWIAFFTTDYLITGPFKAASGADSTASLAPQATLPQLAILYNSTLGKFLPPIANPTSYLVDFSIILALLALLVYWFIMNRTTFGYEVSVIGDNPKAARYAGISMKKNILAVMMIAGAFAGMAGAFRLMGQFPYQLIGSTFRIDTVGFDAIGVALLGHMTAVGILFGALLFGGLRQGAGLMQLQAGVPGDLVFIIQALVLFSVASEFLPAIWRRLHLQNVFVRKPSPSLATAGLEVTMSEMQEDGKEGQLTNGTIQNRGPGEADGREPVKSDSPEEK